MLPAALSSVALAREFVAGTLAEGDASDLNEDAVLLTSEVVTNALLHAGGGCVVTVDVDEGTVRIEVHDEDHQSPMARRPRSDEEGGRGLELVDAIAWRWGSDPVEGDGKAVWFELARSDSGTDDRAPAPGPRRPSVPERRPPR